MLVGCAPSSSTRTVVVRGSDNPVGGTHPGAIREAVGVSARDCRAWMLTLGQFYDGRWEVHLRVPAASAEEVRRRLIRTVGVQSVEVRRKAANPTGPAVVPTTCLSPPGS